MFDMCALIYTNYININHIAIKLLFPSPKRAPTFWGLKALRLECCQKTGQGPSRTEALKVAWNPQKISGWFEYLGWVVH